MMLGYECPCCGELITQSQPGEMRNCPVCHASALTQRIVKQKHSSPPPPTQGDEL